MTPRQILEAAVASLPEGLPRPEVEHYPHLGVSDARWGSAVVSVYVAFRSATCSGLDPLVFRAVAHVLGEVARMLEEQGEAS